MMIDNNEYLNRLSPLVIDEEEAIKGMQGHKLDS